MRGNPTPNSINQAVIDLARIMFPDQIEWQRTTNYVHMLSGSPQAVAEILRSLAERA